MDFALSDEQDALAAAERAWLVKHDPIAARRPSIDDGPARLRPEDLRHLVDSGLAALLTEDMGGTHVDLAVLAEEHGRLGSPLPLAELAIATGLLEFLEHPLYENASAGNELVLPVLASIDGDSLAATIEDGTLSLSGTSAPVCGLIDVGHILVVARCGDGIEVAAVLSVSAVGTRSLDTLDLTRSFSVADIDITLEADQWYGLPAGTAEFVHDQLATFRAFDALGAAARLSEESVDYAKSRHQFGKPIAGFQAIKHHCANMALSVESARAALWAAAVALDDKSSERTTAVSAAAAYAGEATSTVAQTALQVHGGIGFTWEHDLHLLLRRIKVDELLDGTVSFHRRRLVRV
ncbi:acyl-CoA dehydrogenase family protein [Rhodococcus sp. 14-2470-1a]|uniref:acyl-CoA dehydrogenase family protein n=1 Tax=Rhodococcus sp. 14-2470-1a TaxID=2023150 RepID=UPI000B9B3525|nr:acyl-CoA dehydrogenase family protein [Rhodococcus sp. 14-2470-1a]OZF45810.1 acyl-CoA dehydrogenase [Rhodococcus sp. 14-2470-1a]